MISNRNVTKKPKYINNAHFFQRLMDSNKLADINKDKLKIESGRLEEHVNKSCNWWIWIMLAAVCITFVWMVVFMRLFPKR